jgi:phosphate transport system protein
VRAQFHDELDRIRQNIRLLGDQATQAAHRALHALSTLDLPEARAVKHDDRSTDRLRYEVENTCLVLIATQQPVARDLQTLTTAMYVAVELERCGDYAKGVAKAARRIIRNHASAQSVKPYNLVEMEACASDMLQRAVNAFVNDDPLAAQVVLMDDAGVDRLYGELRTRVIGDMVAGNVPVGSGTWLLHAGHCLERFADRAAAISARTILIGNREQVEPVGELNSSFGPANGLS